MTRPVLIALAASLMMSASLLPSLAGDGHKHGKGQDHGAHKHEAAGHGAKHGGQFVETADHHGVEMVLSGTSLVFHMTEDHDPLEVTGSKFKAIIQTDAGTRMVDLKAEGTTLTATLEAPLPKGAKIAITGKDPHGEVIQARFVTE
jgi:hypothetical protein